MKIPNVTATEGRASYSGSTGRSRTRLNTGNSIGKDLVQEATIASSRGKRNYWNCFPSQSSK